MSNPEQFATSLIHDAFHGPLDRIVGPMMCSTARIIGPLGEDAELELIQALMVCARTPKNFNET